MVGARVGFVILGVGWPHAGWLFPPRHPPAGPSKLGTAYDQIDKWLLRRHGLAPLDRERVRRVVAQGHPPEDPALAAAAHDLASKVVAGKLGRLWLAAVRGGGDMIMGAAFLGWGGHGLTPRGHSGGQLFPPPQGLWFGALGPPRRRW